MNAPAPQKGTLLFNEQKYHLNEVLRLAGLGPQITVKRDEMAPAFPVQLTGGEDVPEKGLPIFYKHEGKFIVLAGLHRYLEQAADPKFKGEYKGRLMSTPMLKKARADLQFEVVQPIQPRQGFYDRDSDAIRNRARVIDERQRTRWGGASR